MSSESGKQKRKAPDREESGGIAAPYYLQSTNDQSAFARLFFLRPNLMVFETFFSFLQLKVKALVLCHVHRQFNEASK
jgi:hypothetical protein